MTEDRTRRRVKRAISRTELVVVVLAAVAGLAAIVVGTVVDTSVTPMGADVAAAGPSSSTPPSAAGAGTQVPASSSDESSDAPSETSSATSEATPGEIGEGRSAEAEAPSRNQERKVNPLVEQVEAIARKSQPSTTSFRIATLNILGSNHAGNGLSRAAREAALLRDRGVSIVGLQEVQRDQRPVFQNNLGAMQMWPQDALGRDGYRVQIMWRTDRFEMVDNGGSSHTFNGIGSVPIPYVLLRDKKTGAQFWVIVTHNSPQGRQGERNASAEIQIGLVNKLRETGHPVLLMGDLNEKTTVFCKFATRAGMTAANGGSGGGGCRPPGGPQRIDWILGSADSIEFSGYVQDNTTVANGLSDHHLIYADAKVADKAS
ncbi:endonuclease/exonuclease/phosphatase family protein [Pimelobacter simplex]|uniref:endonuclease/exonuclease/phosphatase family protein n=1 Tax=Nocardioides simplex TaxID=2045 RepID=UPI00366BADAF